MTTIAAPTRTTPPFVRLFVRPWYWKILSEPAFPLRARPLTRDVPRSRCARARRVPSAAPRQRAFPWPGSRPRRIPRRCFARTRWYYYHSSHKRQNAACASQKRLLILIPQRMPSVNAPVPTRTAPPPRARGLEPHPRRRRRQERRRFRRRFLYRRWFPYRLRLSWRRKHQKRRALRFFGRRP